MTVTEMCQALDLRPLTKIVDREVEGAIVTDLISDVLANGDVGQVWVTIQTHRNVAAVGSTQELAAVIITAGRDATPELLALAGRESVNLLVSEEDSYTVAGRLYEMGVR